MQRVEKAVDEQGSAFSWFQAAASLEETIRQRTEQYEQLNVRLLAELESRREIELALKQAKEQADRANETKTRFLAAASHDLRQPLSSALLFLESISESALQGLDLDYLNKARVALASLSNLFDTLLDVARLDSGGIEPQYADFPVSALLDRIVPEFASVARAAGLELKFVSSTAWVRSDLHLLETVLRNLISNAIRYTPRGRLLVGCRRRLDGLLIAVHDTGIGIEAKHLEAIFTAYYQVPAGGRARTSGIGLGLSIVERIATSARLETRGALDTRTRFDVRGAGALRPLALPGSSRTARPPPVPLRTHGLAIAVIDDDPGVRAALAATLIKWGHRPFAAATATEAVVQFIGADLIAGLHHQRLPSRGFRQGGCRDRGGAPRIRPRTARGHHDQRSGSEAAGGGARQGVHAACETVKSFGTSRSARARTSMRSWGAGRAAMRGSPVSSGFRASVELRGPPAPDWSHPTSERWPSRAP